MVLTVVCLLSLGDSGVDCCVFVASSGSRRLEIERPPTRSGKAARETGKLRMGSIVLTSSLILSVILTCVLIRLLWISISASPLRSRDSLASFCVGSLHWSLGF